MRVDALSFWTAPVHLEYWTNGDRRIAVTRTHRRRCRRRTGCAPGDALPHDDSFCWYTSWVGTQVLVKCVHDTAWTFPVHRSVEYTRSLDFLYNLGRLAQVDQSTVFLNLGSRVRASHRSYDVGKHRCFFSYDEVRTSEYTMRLLSRDSCHANVLHS